MRSKADIMWLQSVESTNDELKKRIDTLDNLSVLAASAQTAGRGQRTNTWHSEPGMNLTFSILLKDLPIKAAEQFYISAVTALSVIELLSFHNIDAGIKPPNDIYVSGKKICGILIENALKGENIVWSIIGTGLNVNQKTFPSDLPNPTSFCNETGEEADLEALLEEFMQIFTRYCNRYLNINGGLKKLRQMYLSRIIEGQAHPFI